MPFVQFVANLVSPWSQGPWTEILPPEACSSKGEKDPMCRVILFFFCMTISWWGAGPRTQSVRQVGHGRPLSSRHAVMTFYDEAKLERHSSEKASFITATDQK